MAKPKHRDPRPPLLVQVCTELGRGDIKEKWLGEDDQFVHGQLNGHRVEVNPGVDVVDTLVHELLHRLYPDWSERYVRNRTTFLMRRLTDAELQMLYAEYCKQVGKDP